MAGLLDCFLSSSYLLLHKYWNLVPNNNNIPVKETKIWLSNKRNWNSWCLYYAPVTFVSPPEAILTLKNLVRKPGVTTLLNSMGDIPASFHGHLCRLCAQAWRQRWQGDLHFCQLWNAWLTRSGIYFVELFCSQSNFCFFNGRKVFQANDLPLLVLRCWDQNCVSCYLLSCQMPM